eukprot:4335096-Amphidinium_carterae.1
MSPTGLLQPMMAQLLLLMMAPVATDDVTLTWLHRTSMVFDAASTRNGLGFNSYDALSSYPKSCSSGASGHPPPLSTCPHHWKLLPPPSMLASACKD